MSLISRISLILLTAIAVACGNDEPENFQKPFLTPSSLSLTVGDKATVVVENLAEFEITYNQEIITAVCSEATINVEAIAAGTTELRIISPSVRLTCPITVVSPADVPYDFSPELENDAERYVSRSLSLNYDTPGTIFFVDADGTISIVDITSGNNITFNESTATLFENGKNIPLSKVSIEKTAGERRWFHLVDADGFHIVLVFSSL